MKSVAIYPKTYAVITAYVLYAYRVGHQPVPLTSAEWAVVRLRHGKRRYYYHDFAMTVELDNGEKLVLGRKDINYAGKRHCYAQIGRRIKMYHHPNDTRAWRYKLLGE